MPTAQQSNTMHACRIILRYWRVLCSYKNLVSQLFTAAYAVNLMLLTSLIIITTNYFDGFIQVLHQWSQPLDHQHVHLPILKISLAQVRPSVNAELTFQLIFSTQIPISFARVRIISHASIHHYYLENFLPSITPSISFCL